MKVQLQLNEDGTAIATYPSSEEPNQDETSIGPNKSIFYLLGWLFNVTYVYDGTTHHLN